MTAALRPDLSAPVLRGLEAQLGRLREREAAGARRVGWKIAINDPRAQAALGIAAPVIGYMTSATVVAAGGTHSLAGATRPAVEPEVAIHVGPGAGVAGLGPALEVIDVDLPFTDVEAVLAGNVFHRAGVLGEPVSGAAGLSGCTACMTGAGDDVRIDVAAAALEPAQVIELVAAYLQAVGEELAAGETIIAGSLVTAVPLAGGEDVRLDIDGLGKVALAVEPA